MKMVGSPYVLGIDAGTESVRAGIFDLAGNPVIFHSQEYPVYFPNPGWAEQDPREWWYATVGAVHGAVAKSGLDPKDIIGIGTDCTSCTLVFVDKDLRPLRLTISRIRVRLTLKQFTLDTWHN